MLDYVSESIVENFLLMLDLELKTLASTGGCSLQVDPSAFSPEAFHREIRPTLLYRLLSLTTFSTDGSQGHTFTGGGYFDDFVSSIAANLLHVRDSKNSAKSFVDALALRHFGLSDDGLKYLHRSALLPPLDQVEQLQRALTHDQLQGLLKKAGVGGRGGCVGGGASVGGLSGGGLMRERNLVSTEPEAIFRLATEAYDTVFAPDDPQLNFHRLGRMSSVVPIDESSSSSSSHFLNFLLPPPHSALSPSSSQLFFPSPTPLSPSPVPLLPAASSSASSAPSQHTPLLDLLQQKSTTPGFDYAALDAGCFLPSQICNAHFASTDSHQTALVYKSHNLENVIPEPSILISDDVVPSEEDGNDDGDSGVAGAQSGVAAAAAKLAKTSCENSTTAEANKDSISLFPSDSIAIPTTTTTTTALPPTLFTTSAPSSTQTENKRKRKPNPKPASEPKAPAEAASTVGWAKRCEFCAETMPVAQLIPHLSVVHNKETVRCPCCDTIEGISTLEFHLMTVHSMPKSQMVGSKSSSSSRLDQVIDQISTKINKSNKLAQEQLQQQQSTQQLLARTNETRSQQQQQPQPTIEPSPFASLSAERKSSKESPLRPSLQYQHHHNPQQHLPVTSPSSTPNRTIFISEQTEDCFENSFFTMALDPVDPINRETDDDFVGGASAPLDPGPLAAQPGGDGVFEKEKTETLCAVEALIESSGHFGEIGKQPPQPTPLEPPMPTSTPTPEQEPSGRRKDSEDKTATVGQREIDNDPDRKDDAEPATPISTPSASWVLPPAPPPPPKPAATRKSPKTREAGSTSSHLPICDICGRSYSSNSKLRFHREAVHEGKTVTCPVCGKGMKRHSLPDHLSLHKNGVARPNKKEFACSTCGKIFKAKACVERHENAVHNDVKHVCDVCGAKFSFKEALASHVLNIHQGIKKYACTECDKRFSSSGNRRKHLKTAHRAVEGGDGAADENACGKAKAKRGGGGDGGGGGAVKKRRKRKKESKKNGEAASGGGE